MRVAILCKFKIVAQKWWENNICQTICQISPHVRAITDFSFSSLRKIVVLSIFCNSAILYQITSKSSGFPDLYITNLLAKFHVHTPFKNVFGSCDFSDWSKCHDTIFRKFSQAYCIYVPNLKRIHPVVTEGEPAAPST